MMTRTEMTLSRELAQMLLDGQIRPAAIANDIRGFSITRIDMVRAVLSKGSFVIENRGPLSDANRPEIAKAVVALESLIRCDQFALSTVNHLWDTIIEDIHEYWITALVDHMTPQGLLNLFLTKPSEAFAARAYKPLPEVIAPYVPEAKRDQVAELARSKRKVAEIFRHTGWACCRKAALPGAERDSVMSADLGL